MNFHFDSWLVYFYFYCIFGWVFESTVVSVGTKKLTNRGFMKGPWLPLYGTGALLVLFATLPFQKIPILVFLVGAIAATILEYITGVLMLKIFKVRYWDYTKHKFQFQGHICLRSSIAWGFLSLLMVYVIHQPVVKFIGMWNEELLSILTFVITIIMVFDFANSFRDAMDLRELIIQAEDLKRRLNAAIEEEKEHINDVMEEKWEQIEQSIADAREQREEARINIIEKVEKKREERVEELMIAREKLRQKMEQRSKQLLLHNPGSSFRGLYEESMEIRKRLLERRRGKK